MAYSCTDHMPHFCLTFIHTFIHFSFGGILLSIFGAPIWRSVLCNRFLNLQMKYIWNAYILLKGHAILLSLLLQFIGFKQVSILLNSRIERDLVYVKRRLVAYSSFICESMLTVSISVLFNHDVHLNETKNEQLSG